MSDRRQTRELLDAVAFLAGDYDEPLCCAYCQSESVQHHRPRDVLACSDCRHETTMEEGARERTRKARARLDGGLGGAIVDNIQGKRWIL